MKSLKYYLTSFFITFLCLGTVNAQTQGLGKRLAQDVIAYVSYIELGNIGSKDADCKGANFLTGNVNTIVDKEIIPLLKQIQKKDKKSKNDDVSQYSKQLKKTFASKKIEMELLFLVEFMNKRKGKLYLFMVLGKGV